MMTLITLSHIARIDDDMFLEISKENFIWVIEICFFSFDRN